MTTDIELRRLAEAAHRPWSDGRWEEDKYRVVHEVRWFDVDALMDEHSAGMDRTDAEFAAAASPSVVLSLLDRLASAERDAARWRYMRDHEDTIIEVVTVRKGYRSTRPDAPWEQWDERDGWTTRSQRVESCYPTMDAAIDAALRTETPPTQEKRSLQREISELLAEEKPDGC
jgi:hypothetical protein